jgi:hypothetical protein
MKKLAGLFAFMVMFSLMPNAQVFTNSDLDDSESKSKVAAPDLEFESKTKLTPEEKKQAMIDAQAKPNRIYFGGNLWQASGVEIGMSNIAGKKVGVGLSVSMPGSAYIVGYTPTVLAGGGIFDDANKVVLINAQNTGSSVMDLGIDLNYQVSPRLEVYLGYSFMRMRSGMMSDDEMLYADLTDTYYGYSSYYYLSNAVSTIDNAKATNIDLGIRYQCNTSMYLGVGVNVMMYDKAEMTPSYVMSYFNGDEIQVEYGSEQFSPLLNSAGTYYNVGEMTIPYQAKDALSTLEINPQITLGFRF